MITWFKEAPASVKITVVVVCGIITVAVFAVYTVLTINGEDTTEFRQWINTLGQLLVFPLLGITATASASAAISAKKTEEQTNGNLSRKEQRIVELETELRDKE